MAEENGKRGILQCAERYAALLEYVKEESMDEIIGETSLGDAAVHALLSRETEWHEDPGDQDSADENHTPSKRARTNVHIRILEFDILTDYGMNTDLCCKPLQKAMKTTISNTLTSMMDCKANVLATMLKLTACTKDGKPKICEVQDVGKTLMEILCICCSQDRRLVDVKSSESMTSIQPMKFECTVVKKITTTMQQTSIKDYLYIVRNLKDLALVGADYAVSERKTTDGESRLLETEINGTASQQKLLLKFLKATYEETRHQKALIFKALYVMSSGIPSSFYELGVYLFKILMPLCTKDLYQQSSFAYQDFHPLHGNPSNLTTNEYAQVVCAFRDLLAHEYTRLSCIIDMDEGSPGQRPGTFTNTPAIPFDGVNAVIDPELLLCMRDLEVPEAQECDEVMSDWIHSL